MEDSHSNHTQRCATSRTFNQLLPSVRMVAPMVLVPCGLRFLLAILLIFAFKNFFCLNPLGNIYNLRYTCSLPLRYSAVPKYTKESLTVFWLLFQGTYYHKTSSLLSILSLICFHFHSQSKILNLCKHNDKPSSGKSKQANKQTWVYQLTIAFWCNRLSFFG